MAKALGTPFMPWQQWVADVATEYNPDGSYRYPVVVVSVPRQSGKTTLMRAVGVDRCIAVPDLGCFYTAQTGKDARDRWTDLVKQVGRSPLASRVAIRRAAGQERIVFPNGSEFRCFAPVATSLHGYTPPLVMLDEAFAHDETTGGDLMGAIGPAQVTITRRQLWIVSTAGTAASVFLRQWIDAGRAGQEGVAIFEWAAGDDVDVYDPATWPTFHPAVGRTIPASAIAAEADRLPRSEFERAYGNRWTRTVSHLIPPERWAALACDQLPPPAGLVLSYDVAPDRSSAAIVGTWRDTEGRAQMRVVKAGPGMAWVADDLADYRTRWKVLGVAAHDDGPAREVTDTLRRRGVTVTTIAGREFATAWGFLLQHITDATLGHDGDQLLTDAAANVATRTMGDAAAPSRRASAGDVAPIIAGMVGLWVLDHKPATGPTVARFGSDKASA